MTLRITYLLTTSPGPLSRECLAHVSEAGIGQFIVVTRGSSDKVTRSVS